MKSLEEQFMDMLRQEGATQALQKKHTCYTYMITPIEWERMKKYSENDKCPSCGKRVGLQFFHGNIGDSMYVACSPWGEGCGFKEYISDDD